MNIHLSIPKPPFVNSTDLLSSVPVGILNSILCNWEKMSYFNRGGGVQHELESRASKTSAENSSPESKVALLPVLHTV